MAVSGGETVLNLRLLAPYRLQPACQNTSDFPEGGYQIVRKTRVPTLILGREAPRRFFVTLSDIERSEQTIPDTGHQAQVGIPVFFQVAVVCVMHPRALNPVLQPAWVTKRNVVMPEISVQRVEQGEDTHIPASPTLFRPDTTTHHVYDRSRKDRTGSAGRGFHRHRHRRCRRRGRRRYRPMYSVSDSIPPLRHCPLSYR